MFMGTYYNSIDSKNRVIVPSKYRDKLGGRCVLTIGLDKCLNIYTLEDWEKQVEKISTFPESDQKVRAFKRIFFSKAMECEFDKQGRIGIPLELKEYASIEKELITMGAMNKIEIWSKEVWDAPENSGRIDIEEFASTLKEYDF